MVAVPKLPLLKLGSEERSLERDTRSEEQASANAAPVAQKCSQAAAFHVGMRVWVPDDSEVWTPGTILNRSEAEIVIRLDDKAHSSITVPVNVEARGNVPTPYGTRITPPQGVLITPRGPTPRGTKLSPRTPGRIPSSPRNMINARCLLHRSEELVHKRSTCRVEDLSTLSVLNEAAVLHVLHHRFNEGLIYTHSGPVLLAVNPCRPLPGLYGMDVLQRFLELQDKDGSDSSTAPPHVFSVARSAYLGIKEHSASQTILVSGESGAGKTESTKFVFKYLALAGVGGVEQAMSTIERRVLESNPLLEAFGNATTARNDNSSRFGKYVELQFLPDAESGVPRLRGAQIHTYLLERVRVHSQQLGERNYHIFYQMLAAASRGIHGASYPDGVDLSFLAGRSAESFAYLGGGSAQVPSHFKRPNEDADFYETISAFRTIGLSSAEISALVHVLAAVLHLGDINFESTNQNFEGSAIVRGRSEMPAPDADDQAAQLLGIGRDDLASVLCTRSVKAPGEEKIHVPQPASKAVEARNALSRHLYGQIFNRVNASVNASFELRRNASFCGVLDIFGFEFLDHANSLEQLCINFTNEVLQQYFNDFIFEREAKLYEDEGILWNPLDFPNNSIIVAMLTEPRIGVFPMLDEECKNVGGSDSAWCRKLQANHESNVNFTMVKHRQGCFTIGHFAGPVLYDSVGFIAKNKDLLSADIVTCLKGSTNELVRLCFQEHNRVFEAQMSTTDEGNQRMKRARNYSVSLEFREQLQGLMSRIGQTMPHFVRCIKPNMAVVPQFFDRLLVNEQLRYQGVLQVIEVSRVGYPVRMYHAQACRKFGCLLPWRQRSWLRARLASGDGLRSASQKIFAHLVNKGALLGLPQSCCVVGKTLVFFTRVGCNALDSAVASCQIYAATQLQAAWRRSAVHHDYKLLCYRAGITQNLVRRLRMLRRADKQRKMLAAICLQSQIRQFQMRTQYLQYCCSARRLQRWFRMLRQRLWLLAAQKSARLLQEQFQSALLRRRWRRIRAVVVNIQAAWRGFCGRRQTKEALAQAFRRRMLHRSLMRRWRARSLKRVRDACGASALASVCEDVEVGTLIAVTTALEREKMFSAKLVETLQKQKRSLEKTQLRLERGFFGNLFANVASCASFVCSAPQQESSIEKS